MKGITWKKKKSKQQQLSRLSPWWGCWPGSLPPPTTSPSFPSQRSFDMFKYNEWEKGLNGSPSDVAGLDSSAGLWRWSRAASLWDDLYESSNSPLPRLSSLHIHKLLRCSTWSFPCSSPLSHSFRQSVPSSSSPPPHCSCQHVLISLPPAQFWVWEMEWLRETKGDQKLTLFWKEDVKRTGVRGRKRGENLEEGKKKRGCKGSSLGWLRRGEGEDFRGRGGLGERQGNMLAHSWSVRGSGKTRVIRSAARLESVRPCGM